MPLSRSILMQKIGSNIIFFYIKVIFLHIIIYQIWNDDNKEKLDDACCHEFSAQILFAFLCRKCIK